MTTLSRSTHLASAGTWMLHLATRMLACSLNMPEPLVQNTSVFVFAHVQAVETRATKTLCPIRLLRGFLSRRRNAEQ